MRRTSGALTALTLAALLVVGSAAQATQPPSKDGGKDDGNNPAPAGLIDAVEARNGACSSSTFRGDGTTECPSRV